MLPEIWKNFVNSQSYELWIINVWGKILDNETYGSLFKLFFQILSFFFSVHDAIQSTGK